VIGRERRRAVRRVPADDEPLARVRLRAGRELVVKDVSSAGALVEGDTRLLPGTHVDVHVLTADGRVLVRSRVVRAWVSALRGDCVQYRGALAFERAVDTGYPLPAPPAAVPDAAGTRYPLEAA
jgi:hypothetical protein